VDCLQSDNTVVRTEILCQITAEYKTQIHLSLISKPYSIYWKLPSWCKQAQLQKMVFCLNKINTFTDASHQVTYKRNTSQSQIMLTRKLCFRKFTNFNINILQHPKPKSAMKSPIYWDTTLPSLIVNQHFIGSRFLAYSLTLKVQATCSSMSINYQQTTQCHTPRERTLHNHHCENLKSYVNQQCYADPPIWKLEFWLSILPSSMTPFI
jgi:hypothetical protein